MIFTCGEICSAVYVYAYQYRDDRHFDDVSIHPRRGPKMGELVQIVVDAMKFNLI